MEEPKHIAIVLDGNRRYGKKTGNKFKGHHEGAKRVEELFDWCKELKIKEVTLYAFSTENFNRPKKEVDYLMNLFRKQFKKLNKEISKEENKDSKRVNFIGRLNLFPEDLQKQMNEIMKKTKKNNNFIVNFAVGYGSKAEIVDAVKKIVKEDIEEITEETISENLYLRNNPEIFIRPGGEKRMSNFLLWQCAYSELFFLDKLWPEFSKQDLINILEEYKQRDRRFGE